MAGAKTRSEVQLIVERDRLRAILSSLGEGVDIVSPDYKIYFQNKLLLDRFGDLRGKLCYEGFMERSEPCESCPMVKAIQTNTTQFVEQIGADGRHYEVTTTPFLDTNGETKAIQVVRDITERKRAEEALLRYAKHEEALHAIATTVSQTVDLQQMLDGVLDRMLAIMEVDVANIYIINETAGQLILKAYRGLSEEHIASFSRLKLGRDEVKRAMGWKEPSVAMEKLLNQTKISSLMAILEKEGVQSHMIVPLRSKGVTLGAVVAACRHCREYTREDLVLLQAIANQVVVGIENAQLLEKTRRLSITDELTGLYNYRHFKERLAQEIARVDRYGGDCSVIMLDLDYFKIYNDLFGHVAGDEVLKLIGKTLRDCTRQVDIACRYGGEEFTVILPQTGPAGAYEVAERIRQAMQGALSLEGGTARTPLTISLGIASYPTDGLSREDLILHADHALRLAKDRGRNQTCLASDALDAAQTSGMRRKVARRLESVSLNTIYALAATADAKDHYTYGHSQNVSRYAVAIGTALRLPKRRIERLRIAALLHDIGKIGLPDSVIRKPGLLNDEEREIMRKHSELGAALISHNSELADCAPAIRHHHEWWDGSGYPTGLKGEAIPLEARIIAIAEAYDTMTTPRSYRQTLPPQEAIQELRRCASIQFDPYLVEKFSL